MKRLLMLVLLVGLMTVSYGMEEKTKIDDLRELSAIVEVRMAEEESTAGMMGVQEFEYHHLEKLIDKKYVEITEKLEDDQWILFEGAQKSWDEYVKKELIFYRDYYDNEGTIWSLYYGEKRNSMFRKRVEALENLAEELEGY